MLSSWRFSPSSTSTSFRHGLGWGTPLSGALGGGDGATGELGPGDAGVGRGLWLATCRSCHGVGGEGVEGQGKDLRQSEFLQNLDDPALLAFVRKGRTAADPLNTTGKPMPPRGGNPMLKGPQLMDVIAFIRTIQIPIDEPPSGNGDEQAEPDAVTPAVDEQQAEPPVETSSPEQAESGDEFWIPRSSVPLAAAGPTGLSLDAFQPPVRPDRAGLFFAVFFLMTGVHAIQVLIGLSILLGLIYRATQAPYRTSQGVPVHVLRNYWYLVVSVWIVIFPLFYLIR